MIAAISRDRPWVLRTVVAIASTDRKCDTCVERATVRGATGGSAAVHGQGRHHSWRSKSGGKSRRFRNQDASRVKEQTNQGSKVGRGWKSSYRAGVRPRMSSSSPLFDRYRWWCVCAPAYLRLPSVGIRAATEPRWMFPSAPTTISRVENQAGEAHDFLRGIPRAG